jgi:hypothetical protein
MDWAVARAAGFFRGPELGGGGEGTGGEGATVFLPAFVLVAAFPRRAAGAGGGSANSSSWDRPAPCLAFAPARDRVPPRGFDRVPVADLFPAPDRAFTLPFVFAVFLRDAFAKRSLLLANSAV